MTNDNNIDAGDLIINSSEIKPRSYKDKKCAPGLRFEDGACMPLDILIDMADGYNKYFPNKKIKLSEKLETLNPKQYKRYLVKEFSKRLEDVCDNQKCWIKQSFMKELNNHVKKKAVKYVYRPDGPDGQFTWLNTHNVNDVMEQYENIHDDFKFFGAVPIDFDNLKQLEICGVDFNNVVNSGKHKIGVVFNLDESYKSGSHWVACYLDLKKGQVYFFDSYGVAPEARIRKFMRKAENFLKQKGINNTDVRFNKTRHQYENSECGVYSLNFIIRMLEGETFDDINNKRIPDSEVNKMRKVYFL